MKLSAQLKKQKAFTLIELLVVIGVLAVLLAITLIAINPARQFQQANNTKRQSDVGIILNAINQYMAGNNGSLPAGIPATAVSVATAVNIGNAAGGADICTPLVSTYIAALPFDPNAIGAHFTSCTDYDLQYSIYQSANSRITIFAPSTEPATAPDISVTR